MFWFENEMDARDKASPDNGIKTARFSSKSSLLEEIKLEPKVTRAETKLTAKGFPAEEEEQHPPKQQIKDKAKNKRNITGKSQHKQGSGESQENGK
jgi:hypothetical protein